MPECSGGCLCDHCCDAARDFAYRYWRLDEEELLEDDAEPWENALLNAFGVV